MNSTTRVSLRTTSSSTSIRSSKIIRKLPLKLLLRFSHPKLAIHYVYYQLSSAAWRQRIRSLKLWRFLHFLLLIILAEIAAVWINRSNRTQIEAFTSHGLYDLFLYPLIRLAIFLLDISGIPIVMLAVVYAYTFGLKLLNQLLPGLFGLVLTGLLFVVGIKFDSVRWLAATFAVNLYPDHLHQIYLSALNHFYPILTIIVSLISCGMFAISVAARLIVFRGYSRHGGAFRNMVAYERWAGPVDPIPSVLSMVRDRLDRIWQFLKGGMTVSPDSAGSEETHHKQTVTSSLSGMKPDEGEARSKLKFPTERTRRQGAPEKKKKKRKAQKLARRKSRKQR